MKRNRLLFLVPLAALVVGGATLAVNPARAASPKALILASTVSPGSATDGSGKSLEQQQAEAAGFVVTLANDATWKGMSASDFGGYQALVIGDPVCGGSPSYYAAAQSNASTWEPVVMSSGGNKVLIGTDPTYHHGAHPGATTLEKSGIAFAGAKAGATGAYIDLSCAYTSGASNTPVPILDGLSSHGTGQFNVDSAPCEGNISIVAQSGPTAGLHDADLSGWSCSVHESFVRFPSDYTPLALATDAPSKGYCAKDVDTGAEACGEPYVMLSGSGVAVSSNIKLEPSSHTDPVGGSHTLTATVTKSGAPESGKTVNFSIESGPNVRKSGSGVTNSSGQATFTYVDSGGAGTDEISATFTDDAGALEKATATETWSASATSTTSTSTTPTSTTSTSTTSTSTTSTTMLTRTTSASTTSTTMLTRTTSASTTSTTSSTTTTEPATTTTSTTTPAVPAGPPVTVLAATFAPSPPAAATSVQPAFTG